MDQTNTTDETLVEAALAGETAAFGTLFDRYAGVVRAVCFEMTGDVCDAQDLTQDVFMKAFQKMRSLRNPRSFGPWIVGIARLEGRQWRRTRARDRHKFIDSEIQNSIEADNNFLESEAFEELHAALLELSEKERMAVHLYYLNGQAAHHTRSLLGLSLSGFYRVLERGREKLRKRLLRGEEFQR